jgi:hypothetical protein
MNVKKDGITASEEGNGRKPWRYTDDLIAGALVLAYIAGHVTGNFQIPIEVMMLVFGWVFGKGI